VFCVYRSWNLKILEALTKIQETKEWKITLVIAPKEMKIPNIDGIKILKIDPKELEKYSQKIKSENPHVIICYGWSWIIPKSILDIAPCLVLHPSPLPKYRGGSPIQNQLIDGVKQSAVSIIYATEKLDAGNILAQEPISFEGYLQDIVDRMSDIGLRLTIDILDKMSKGVVKGTPQEESQATVVKRRKPPMSEITIEEIKTKSAEYLYNKIRGLQDPYPKAFIVCGDGKKIFITRAHLEE
jgi:methionyl-tRNA formyltransferase